MLRHRLAAVAALTVVAVECGAGGMPADDVAPAALRAGHPGARAPAAAPAADLAAIRDAQMAEALPRRSAPVAANRDTSRRSLPKTVEVVRPDLRLDGVVPFASALVHTVDGVEDAVAVGSLQVSSPTADGLEQLTALAVDEQRFRRFTPDVTANEVGVWERLREGNAVLTAAVAHRVDVKLGRNVTLSGSRSSESLRVGALAANGLPQLADLLLPSDAAHRLSDRVQDTLLVAVADDANPSAVAAALQEEVGGEVTELEEPEAQQVQPRAGTVGQTTLESFTYQSVGDGTIRIDPDWVARNIVTTTVPLLGRVTCHRVIIDQLRAALEEIRDAGLGGEIYMYSGCWVPRHIVWDPNRGISRHAWGLAFDINVPTNGYGASPQLDPRVVEVFQRWGFRWGGTFSTPDGMHFELARIVQR